jgi:hypothetical protein
MKATGQLSALEIQKLEVLNVAMGAMYGHLWRERWPMNLLVKYWSPILAEFDAIAVANCVARIVSTRTASHPPIPAEFRELLKPLAPVIPDAPLSFADRSPAANEHMAAFFKANPWLRINANADQSA